MAKAYYGTKISDNMSRTPEGFLICHNVPIARTGWQEYIDQEIRAPDASGKRVQVFRSDDDVFNQATIASFEMKSVTDGHPNNMEWVTPENFTTLEKGQTTNVRRGSGDNSDLLLADLVIKDPILISKIEAGKREVSCGYDCKYHPIDGGYAQTNILGNHVAIVEDGRAGPRVAIQDAKPKIERSKPMKFSNTLIKALGWKSFVNDASTEELADALKTEEDPGKTKDEGGEVVPAWAKEIIARLDKLEAAEAAEKKPAVDALDALEKELGEGGSAAGEGSEESKTVPAENMDADPDPETKKEKPAPTTDAAMKQAVAVARAIVSGLPEGERQAASQRAADALRKDFPKRNDGYQELLKRKTVDGAGTQEEDPTAFGKNCAKLNPHTKK